jgi:hypothetical protein
MLRVNVYYIIGDAKHIFRDFKANEVFKINEFKVTIVIKFTSGPFVTKSELKMPVIQINPLLLLLNNILTQVNQNSKNNTKKS